MNNVKILKKTKNDWGLDKDSFKTTSHPNPQWKIPLAFFMASDKKELSLILKKSN